MSEEMSFGHLAGYLERGDLVVLNDSKVIPTRLWGTIEDGGQREVTILCEIKEGVWKTAIRPDIGITIDTVIRFGKKGALTARVARPIGGDAWDLKFSGNSQAVYRFLRRHADINLPFYLKFPLKDRRRYQNVYARNPGSCLPPTAGMNFTEISLANLRKRGIGVAFITLHISGSIMSSSFRRVEDAAVLPEWYSMPQKTARQIMQTKLSRNRVVAVGTTVVRALESAVDTSGDVRASQGWTNLTILPGFKFRVTDSFLTNFHLPCSSHLFLTCAFGGRERVMGAYRKALQGGYSFLDFGDSMLIL